MGKRRRAPLVIAAVLAASGALVASGPVEIQNLDKPGKLEIRVSAPISLASKADVEMWRNGRWVAVPVDMKLIDACGQPPPAACREFKPGDVFRPLPWSGYTCSAQCTGHCRANKYLGPGTFRFVLRSCDQTQSFRGDSFKLPPNPKK